MPKIDKRIKKYFLKDGSIRYGFRAYLGTDELTGKEVRVKRNGFKTSKDATLALNTLELEFENKVFRPTTDIMTFGDVYNLWFEVYKTSVKKSTYQELNDNYQRHIMPIFAKLRISKISSALCQKAINNWYKKYANANKYRSILNRVFKYALSLNLVDNNPIERTIIPHKKAKEKKIDFFDKQDLNYFLNFVKDNYPIQTYTYFRLLAYSGMRKGEAGALQWCDINFRNNTISITKTAYQDNENKGVMINDTPKTSSSVRTIDIDNETMNILEKWKIEQTKLMLSHGYNPNTKHGKQYVFTKDWTKNTPLNYSVYNSLLRRLLQRDDYQGKRISIHGFRHTHASLLFEAGASIKEVQERLGHSNIQTTLNIYTHVTKNAKKETANKFFEYMSL
ncbi:tyrosine-type recombinase/integrase [Ligilactobacillus salivarius]|uniref:tyrosine-type recombinase/integrase n=1 Tax=Ligilactobacillus salivarius TaxID=1624 RepID=UPI0023680F10|nr:site-specific integrase [Ligilactobacillus salivarius]